MVTNAKTVKMQYLFALSLERMVPNYERSISEALPGDESSWEQNNRLWWFPKVSSMFTDSTQQWSVTSVCDPPPTLQDRLSTTHHIWMFQSTTPAMLHRVQHEVQAMVFLDVHCIDGEKFEHRRK
ncbi:hypothetical protein AVEN_67659-1 [Araneus ventricosus]|uniref:Uncharacterized protein n=1 Tax=Araneus ventricosus TaxID=182803 RepID=A0A4Y2QUR6_ARAVE|nr:hypothetical protein AVEN_67659-1 [Araneus ventricosus]